MLSKINNTKSKYFLLLNSAFFVFCLRPPGMSAIILILTIIALINVFSSGLIIKYEKKFKYFYFLIFLMISRCIIGFVFNGGYEERYLPVLMLFLCLLIIHLLSCRDIELNQCYTGFYYATIVSLGVVIFEVATGHHLSTSRYSDPTNDAQLWSVSKPTAFYYNENDMLSFLVCFFPFAVFYAKRNLYKIVILLLTLFSAIYIGSKAAILALFIYVLFTKTVSKKIILILSGCAAILILILSPTLVADLSFVSNTAFARLMNFWDTLVTTGASDESTSERLQIYLANVDWLLNHAAALLFGNGRFGDYEADIIHQYGLRMGEFHNIHLEMITIYGIIFYLMYFSYYIFLVYNSFKISRFKTEMKPLITSAILYPALVSFGPSSSLKYPFLFILTFLMIIGINAYEKSNKAHI